jgi:hypothetical protein
MGSVQHSTLPRFRTLRHVSSRRCHNPKSLHVQHTRSVDGGGQGQVAGVTERRPRDWPRITGVMECTIARAQAQRRLEMPAVVHSDTGVAGSVINHSAIMF